MFSKYTHDRTTAYGVVGLKAQLGIDWELGRQN